MDFIKTPNGTELIPATQIVSIDITELEELKVKVTYGSLERPRTICYTGILAIELLLKVYPSALEGRRLRWARHAWFVHNLVGHPLMQVLAFFRLHKLALWVHEVTVPRPLRTLRSYD